ncbi:DUF4129 domain-containing protein [soil metagenome]
MRLVFIIFFIFCSCTLFAQLDSMSYDSSAIMQRSFSSASIDAYKKNKDFQYETKVVETPSVWDRFWNWFWKLVEDILGTPEGQATLKVLYWALGIGAIAFFVYKVIRMNRLSVFANESKASDGYKIDSEDIHTIPFDLAINEALQQGNHRLAVRLLYLQHLKLLADKNMIAWQPNKTNTDYWRELTNETLQQIFKSATNIFEYAWYGSHTVSKDDYAVMKEELMKFQNRLQ